MLKNHAICVVYFFKCSENKEIHMFYSYKTMKIKV